MLLTHTHTHMFVAEVSLDARQAKREWTRPSGARLALVARRKLPAISTHPAVHLAPVCVAEKNAGGETFIKGGGGLADVNTCASNHTCPKTAWRSHLSEK